MESIHRVFLPSFPGDVEFEAAHSRSNFGRIEVPRYSIGMVRGVVQVIPKLVYRNSESYPKFEVRMR